MASRELRVGIIGAGFMGRTHSFDYRTMGLFYDDLPFTIRLVGICDTDRSRAEKHRAEFGFETATNRYQDLTERDDIDVIDVSTPTLCHAEQIMAALDGGKHLYVDKPLCMSGIEADTIVRRAALAPTVKQIAYHYRFYPGTMKARMLIDDGFLGTPISFRVEYYHSSNLDPAKSMGWKQDKAMGGGGVLIEMACHAIDLLYSFFGRYARMSMQSIILYGQRPDASGAMRAVEGEDHVLLNVRMQNGMIGTIEVSKVAAGSNDDFNFALYGSRGAIKYESMNPNFLSVYDATRPPGPIGGTSGFQAIETVNKYPDSKSQFPGPRFGIGWLRGHVACHHSFLMCVASGSPASPSLEDGAYIQKVIERVYAGVDDMSDLV
jgi:predicted dehydrogenase